MCTLIILRRQNHRWPVLVAANRDEMLKRPWLAPGRHWPRQINVIAGLDQSAGGSWLGINKQGVIAGIMNRKSSLGKLPGFRSRGELVLKALANESAREAAKVITDLDPHCYRSYNLVLADCQQAIWICWPGKQANSTIKTHKIPLGLSMFTAYDRNDLTDPRIRTYLPRFQSAAAPEPDSADWTAWQNLLASRASSADNSPLAAMTVETDQGFGTVSSALMALPACQQNELQPLWYFASGPPDREQFEPIEL